MGLGIQNSMGVAKQFMNKPKPTYEKRMQGVPLNWQVETAGDKSRSRMAQAMTNLTMQLNQNRKLKEERMALVAEETVPEVLAQAHHNNKEKLNAIEMVAQSGKAYLQDNPYAIALIDRHKGEEIQRKIMEGWKEKSSHEPMSATLEEESKKYSDYYKEQMEALTGEEDVVNKYAFDQGMFKGELANQVAVETEYSKKKEQKYKFDLMETSTSKAQGISRDAFQNSVEVAQADMDALANELKISATGDLEFNDKRIRAVTEIIAENGGVKGMNAWAEREISEGVKLKDYMNLSPYFDLATTSDKAFYNKEYLGGYNIVKDSRTSEDFDRKLETIPDLETRRRIAKEKADILAGNEQASMRHLGAKSQLGAFQAKRAYSLGASNAMLEAMDNNRYSFSYGGGTYNIPRSEDDLKELGIDKSEFKDVMNMHLLSMYHSGEIEHMGDFLRNPLVGKNFKKYISTTVSPLLKAYEGGELDEGIQMAMALQESLGGTAGEYLGNDVDDELSTLRSMQETFGTDIGGSLYHEGVLVSQNDEVKKKSQALISAEIDSHGLRMNINEVEVEVNARTNGRIHDKVKAVASRLYMTGRYAEQEALQVATKAISDQHFNVRGTLIPYEAIDLNVEFEAPLLKGKKATLWSGTTIDTKTRRELAPRITEVIDSRIKAKIGVNPFTILHDSKTKKLWVQELGAMNNTGFSIDLDDVTREACVEYYESQEAEIVFSDTGERGARKDAQNKVAGPEAVLRAVNNYKAENKKRGK